MRNGIAVLLGTVSLFTADLVGAQNFGIERVADGLARPIFLTAPPGDTERVFIPEQHTGAIRILKLATRELLGTPFLTVPGLTTNNEQGLLGLAFHPDYASNGWLFVYATQPGVSAVWRYTVSGDPDLANPASAKLILAFIQPQINHNAGWMGFGPDDDLLYISSGDGGGSNDSGSGHTPMIGNAQDTGNLLGKILRIDVDGVDDFPLDFLRNYAIPPGNPFVGVAGDDAIWAYGLRNAWRASFDRETGDFWIADVGQGRCEEITVQPAASAGGENYGWRLREGSIQTPGSVGGPAPPGAIDPIMDYPHFSFQTCASPGAGPGFTGFAVTGGYVYRGSIGSLRGRYFFSDNATSRLWSLIWDGTDPALNDGNDYTDLTDHTGDPDFTPDVGSFGSISAFGEDDAGNLYIVDLDGSVFLLPEPSAPLTQVIGFAALLGLRRLRRR